MKAGFLLSLTEPSLAAEAAAAARRGRRRSPTRGNDARARPPRRAARLAAGDWAGAGDGWDELLRRHPRDALALQWAHLFDFYRGDAAALRERVDAVLPAWPRRRPAPSLRARRCTPSASRSRAATPRPRRPAGARWPATARVPWAIHAVAHVMEMQGRHEEGARWMAATLARRRLAAKATASPATSAGTRRCSRSRRSTRAAALRVFDAYLDAEPNEITLQRVDAASLLWRLHLLGVDVGDRWQRARRRLAARRTAPPAARRSTTCTRCWR